MMSDVLILPTPSVSLVFGMDWLPLINGQANRVAYRTAREHRATHLAFAGDTAAAVGLVALRLSRAQRRKSLVSAAQNVAQLFANGTIALLLELEPVRVWLVAVHQGAIVARTDKLYNSRADAQAALRELRQAYPQLVELGAANAPGLPTLPEIVAASTKLTQLIPLSRWRSVLPVPVQWFLLSLLVVALIPRIWLVAAPESKESASSDSIDPTLAWQEAIFKASRNRVIHGVDGTRSILHSFHELPVRLAGWSLVRATCTAAQPAWRCHARYDRSHREASNDGFLASAPKTWSIEFSSIDHAQPVWHVKAPGVMLAGHRLKSGAHNERHLFSVLQRIKPAFSQIQLGKAQALKVAPPRDPQGKAIPEPPGMPQYRTRSVRINGPLRSGGLLLSHTTSIGWREISLSIHDAGQVGLKKSRINVSFQGELYEVGIADADAGSVRVASGMAQPGGGSK